MSEDSQHPLFGNELLTSPEDRFQEEIEEQNNAGQIPLFSPGEGTVWKEEWQDMPEFVQESMPKYSSVIVHFETEADLKAFAKLVEQPVYKTTQSLWYPRADIGRYANKRFIRES